MDDRTVIDMLDEDVELSDPFDAFDQDEESDDVVDDVEEAEALSVEERLTRLLEDVQGLKPVFIGTIDFCRDKKRPAEVDERYAELTEYNFCTFSPVRVRALLEEAGALCYIEGEDISCPDSVAASEGEGEIAPDTSEAQETVAAVAVEDIPVSDDAEQGESDYYEITTRPEGWWQATDEGLAFIDDIDPVRDALQMIDGEAGFEEAYRLLLQALADGVTGLDDLQAVIEQDPAISESNRYVSSLIKRLEENAIIEFRGNWTLLPAGEALLANMQEG